MNSTPIDLILISVNLFLNVLNSHFCLTFAALSGLRLFTLMVAGATVITIITMMLVMCLYSALLSEHQQLLNAHAYYMHVKYQINILVETPLLGTRDMTPDHPAAPNSIFR